MFVSVGFDSVLGFITIVIAGELWRRRRSPIH
jgi:hypothetical protein